MATKTRQKRKIPDSYFRLVIEFPLASIKS